MSGGTVCSVSICKNNSTRLNAKGEKVTFFSFPKDPVVRKKWVQCCRRQDKFNPEHKRICREHFTDNDYEDEMEARLMNTRPKKLKKSAVPSLLLSFNTNKGTPSASKRAERAQKRLYKSIVDELLADKALADKPEVKNSSVEVIPTTSSGLEETLKETNQIKDELQKEKELNIILRQENKTLKEKIVELNKKVENSEREFLGKVKEVFKDCLTPNQVEIALKIKSRAQWTEDELCKAFTLRYLGIRSYIFLRQTLNYPLPGISTLQKWAASLDFTSGLLKDVFLVMESAGQVKSSYKKTTVLSFAEMKVCSLYEYDEKEDEVLGPHSYLQVVMARGLFQNWKHPVFLGFDTKVTANLLGVIVKELHKIGYNVVACVSDLGPGNQSLWTELGISISNTSYLHPETNEPIFFFADAPHMLKLIRNRLLNSGFTLSDGTVINGEPIKSLISVSPNENVSSLHKLTLAHLELDDVAKENVKLAAELLSYTTAMALELHLPGKDPTDAKNVGDFVHLVSDWFDMFNSYSACESTLTKRPYGLEIEQQDEKLEEVLRTMSGLRCAERTGLLTFQKGMIVSIKSLKDLYHHVHNKYEAKYILTHRLSKDCLEKFLTQLQTRESLHGNPSPLNAIWRVQMIVHDKNPELVQLQPDVDVREPGKFVATSALETAKLQNVQVKDSKLESLLGGLLAPAVDDSDESSSSSSSCSSTSPVIRLDIVEEDGLTYLAGYLANQNLKKYPDLGQNTSKNESITIDADSYPSWIRSLSLGNLILPSDSWMTQVQEMEKHFLKMHENKFGMGKNISLRTSDYIKRQLENDNIMIPKDLVHNFSRLRILMRIKFLNKVREKDKLTKRKSIAPSKGPQSKLAKKDE